MASKSKPVNQQKCRKIGLTSGPLRATQSFGLTPKKAVEPDRLQTSTLCVSESIKVVAAPHQLDAKDSRRSSSPDSPSVLRRGKKGSSSTAAIHRSSSFDTISSTYYLSGTWPRVGVPRGRSSSPTSESILDPQPQTKPRGSKSSKESNGVGSGSPSVLPFVVSSSSLSSLSFPSNKTASGKFRRSRHRGVSGGDAVTLSHGSLEGLNQELEKLDLSSSSSESSRLDGRRAPVVDLLAANNHATSSRPMDSENMSSETVYIPSVEPEMEGGVSGSPPAILDNWLQLQRALTLESLDNDDHRMNLLPKAVKRLPPDGCEHFLCKVNELQKTEPPEQNGDTSMVVSCHIPSATSAFYPPLLDNYLCRSSDQHTSSVDQTPTSATE